MVWISRPTGATRSLFTSLLLVGCADDLNENEDSSSSSPDTFSTWNFPSTTAPSSGETSQGQSATSSDAATSSGEADSSGDTRDDTSSSDTTSASDTTSSSDSTSGSPEDTDPTRDSSSSSDAIASTDTESIAHENPTPAEDMYRIRQGEVLNPPASQGLLHNDTGSSGGVLEVVPQTLFSAAGALVDVRADGSFLYRPPVWWWGEDIMDYEVVDHAGGSAMSRFRIVTSPVVLNLGQVAEGQGGFSVLSEGAGDQLGQSVAGAGDINADGIPDIIVSAPRVQHEGIPVGRIYVVWGHTPAMVSPVDLAEVAEGRGGFAILGDPSWPVETLNVEDAGDVNDDGFADILVHAQGREATGALRWRTYIVFGRVTAPEAPIDTEAPIDLAEVAQGLGGFAMEGSGWPSAESAGDLNGDRFADLVVASVQGDNQVYVVWGSDEDRGAVMSLEEVVAEGRGFAIDGGAALEGAPSSASGAGDINGDGFADLIIGDSDATPRHIVREGRCYVIFGHTSIGEAPVVLSDIAMGIGGFAMNGGLQAHYAGDDVGSAGDMNGDGLSDLLVIAGGFFGDYPSGEVRGLASVYVVFGQEVTPSEPLDLSNIGGRPQEGISFGIGYHSEFDRRTVQVAKAGDFNGDGFGDLLIGGGLISEYAYEDPERSYLIYGDSQLSTDSFSDLNAGRGGFAIDGEVPYRRIHAVTSVGDLNGDGFSDIMVGSMGVGRGYVVYGGDYPRDF